MDEERRNQERLLQKCFLYKVNSQVSQISLIDGCEHCIFMETFYPWHFAHGSMSGLIWSTRFSVGAQFKIKASQNLCLVKYKSNTEPINIPSKNRESYPHNGIVTE